MAVTESTDTLSIQAAAQPDALAVFVDPSGGATPSSTTFAELEALANQLAHGWRALGIDAGERLVWCGPNSLEVIATIHGARKASLVSVPLSYRFIGDEMQYVVDNAEASVVIIDAEQAPTLAGVMDRLPTVRKVVVFGGPVPEDSGFLHWDDLVAGQPTTEMEAEASNSLGATMVYTSGTTGKPKGAMRSSSDKGIVGAMMMRLGLLEGDHRHLTTGPLYHSGPLSFAALNHSIGAPIYVLRKFDPVAWLRIVRDHR
ncbi:MAG: putative fatty-acid--CoA ligase, partial [Actinomycetia bacterium]|nr:putative fatty-acid--CoA ligase [Actinomycetes bacterium]